MMEQSIWTGWIIIAKHEFQHISGRTKRGYQEEAEPEKYAMETGENYCQNYIKYLQFEYFTILRNPKTIVQNIISSKYYKSKAWLASKC